MGTHDYIPQGGCPILNVALFATFRVGFHNCEPFGFWEYPNR